MLARYLEGPGAVDISPFGWCERMVHPQANWAELTKEAYRIANSCAEQFLVGAVLGESGNSRPVRLVDLCLDVTPCTWLFLTEPS